MQGGGSCANAAANAAAEQPEGACAAPAHRPAAQRPAPPRACYASPRRRQVVLEAHDTAIQCADFRPAAQQLATCCQGCTVKVWSFEADPLKPQLVAEMDHSEGALEAGRVQEAARVAQHARGEGGKEPSAAGGCAAWWRAQALPWPLERGLRRFSLLFPHTCCRTLAAHIC